MWEVVWRLPAFADAGHPCEGPTPVLPEFGEWRAQLQDRFGACSVTLDNLAWIVDIIDGCPVLKVGARRGYWAWQLN
ncbi:hypothetical protein OG339_48570 (plasmid) [Streptosporangium sp. NBC_01495]|uniref:hypothetical protein n=1 Tax=Streptosporangium sp. NBC_01495 TaxID=2903899 RepID=UPI002E37D176|nr:hypothetical protein [Streptosporangium sp. NBC_01495]